MYHNIEKSAFRKGEYVGHATGSWRIRKDGKQWRASRWTGLSYDFEPATIYGTLRHISAELDRINSIIARELRAKRLPNPFASVEV